MEEIYINIGKINLFVTGKYIKEEEDVGYPEQFDIKSIECKESNLCDLLEWVSLNNNYLDIIEELVLKSR